MNPKKKELSTSLKYFFGIGDFGFNLMSNVENYYFQFFLTNAAMFSVSIAGIISTIYTVVDAALSWIYGALLLIFCFRLTRDDVMKYQTEIDQRA